MLYGKNVFLLSCYMKKKASFIWLTVCRKYADIKLDTLYQIYCV